MAVLAANVTGVKSRAAAAEQRLKAEVAGLEATETRHDAAQERSIAALSAKVLQGSLGWECASGVTGCALRHGRRA